MQQTYQHPWYKQQELLENTTNSESKSTQRPNKDITGLKCTKSLEWAAGLFEGEGCLSYSKTDRWELQVQMTDPDTVQDFYEAVGFVGNYHGLYKSPARPEHHKPYATWRTSTTEIIFEIVVRFYQYLGKRRQAKVKEFLVWYGSK